MNRMTVDDEVIKARLQSNKDAIEAVQPIVKTFEDDIFSTGQSTGVKYLQTTAALVNECSEQLKEAHAIAEQSQIAADGYIKKIQEHAEDDSDLGGI